MSAYPEQALTGVTAGDLSWLTGNWRGLHGTDMIDEHWSATGAGALMGMFRWERNGQVWFYEFMTLEPHAGGLVLRIKHFYPGLLGWEEKDSAAELPLVQLTNHEAVFLQRHAETPTWLVYRREGNDRLIAYFDSAETPASNTDRFIYTRQSL